jgi:hypothetical protein
MKGKKQFTTETQRSRRKTGRRKTGIEEDQPQRHRDAEKKGIGEAVKTERTQRKTGERVK